MVLNKDPVIHFTLLSGELLKKKCGLEFQVIDVCAKVIGNRLE